MESKAKVPILGKTLSNVLNRYYFGPDHPSKMRLWEMVFRALGYPRLTVPYFDRAWISIDHRDYPQLGIWVSGAYEAEVWDNLERFVEKSEVVWDVGAHIGGLSIRAGLDHRIAEVFAFEPHPKTHQVLRENIFMNQIPVTAVNCAISDEETTRNLYFGPIANTGISSLHQDPSLTGSTPVVCHTIDHLIYNQGTPPPTLMKIDVEGHEGQVFKGGERFFRDSPPKAVVLESRAFADGSFVDKSLVEHLNKLGYEVSHIVRPEGILHSNENYLARLK